MRKRMNFHRLAGAKRHSRAGGNLLIYSTNLLRIYSLPPWRNMFFETADNADYADFTQIKFLNAHPSMLRQAQQPKRRERREPRIEFAQIGCRKKKIYSKISSEFTCPRQRRIKSTRHMRRQKAAEASVAGSLCMTAASAAAAFVKDCLALGLRVLGKMDSFILHF